MELIPFSMTDNTIESYLGKVSPKSRIIYWIIIGFVAIVLVALPFVSVDITVQASGFFQSEIEKQFIYAPFQGKVVFTSIENGKEVKKGDTLFIIDTETIKTQKEAINIKVLDNNAAIDDLEKLVLIESLNHRYTAEDFSTKRYYSEFLKMKKSLTVQFQRYQKSKAEHERNVILHDQDIIPDIEFEKSLFAYKTDSEDLGQVLISFKSIWQADLMERKSNAGSLQADLERCIEELNNRVVLAPVAGEIIQSVDIQTGSFLLANQKIAEISPIGRLVATCYLKPDDIGLIHTGQNVRLQVDALNYNEWGFLNAKIIDISDDMIVEDGSTAYFRIRCMPEQTSLYLRNGAEAQIRKGMSFNSRIFVTRRSLFNLLFDKADKWLNPYSTNQS